MKNVELIIDEFMELIAAIITGAFVIPVFLIWLAIDEAIKLTVSAKRSLLIWRLRHHFKSVEIRNGEK